MSALKVVALETTGLLDFTRVKDCRRKFSTSLTERLTEVIVWR
jgi:hypothetical protein